MDALQANNKLAENDTFMRYLFSDQLKMDGGTLDKMLAEFEKSRKKADANEDEGGGGMMNESAPDSDDPANWTHEELVAFARYVTTPGN